jgi:hypothetical protein
MEKTMTRRIDPVALIEYEIELERINGAAMMCACITQAPAGEIVSPWLGPAQNERGRPEGRPEV